MAKRKLTDVAPSFDEWFAAYLVTHHLEERETITIDEALQLAKRANIRGYLIGSKNAMEIMKGH